MSKVFYGLSRLGRQRDAASSSSGTTTTSWAGRRRRRSSPAGAAITASGVMIGRADRPRLLPHGLRPAAARRSCTPRRPHYYCRGAEPGESEEQFSARLRRRARGADPARGPRHGRRLHRRAGPGHGRHRAAARRLLGGDPGGAAQARLLLIADEVVTGFGRLGRDVRLRPLRHRARPDHLAKGLTCAYAPLSGVIVGEKVWKVLEQATDKLGAIGHGWTYSGHPLGAAAAQRQSRHRRARGPAGQRGETGAHFQRAPARDVRRPPAGRRGAGRGPDGGARVRRRQGRDSGASTPRSRSAPRVSAALLEQGVIARAMPHGDILGFAPPLVVTPAEADEIVAIAKRAVDRVTRRAHPRAP